MSELTELQKKLKSQNRCIICGIKFKKRKKETTKVYDICEQCIRESSQTVDDYRGNDGRETGHQRFSKILGYGSATSGTPYHHGSTDEIINDNFWDTVKSGDK